MKPIKIITAVALIASLGSIIIGYVIETSYSKKLIGFGVLGIFFIVFPLFSYYRWKDKDPKDYMITKESLDKMREKQKENNY